MMQEKTQRLLPLLVPVAVLAVFLPAVFNGFVNWDDDYYIFANPLIQNWSWTSLKNIFLGFHAHYYAPLTFLSFGVEHLLAGTAPWLYHLDNVLLHALNGYLSYRFCLLLSGHRGTALLSALLFALHPLRVESVAWVTERKDLLYASFYLLALNAYLNYLDRELKPRFLIASSGWLLCSLLSKPMAVTLPLALLAIDFYRRRTLTLRMIAEKLPHALLAAVFVKITWAS
ncbi:MAG TPA: hypothetical protein PLL10_03565, partial [Elusimicrobiales bacterium]|nr:hypothetical protein [Elusimicrobiales bacterium]